MILTPDNNIHYTVPMGMEDRKNMTENIHRLRRLGRLGAIVMSIFVIFAATVLAERASVSEMDRICRNWLTFHVAAHGSWNGETAPQIKGSRDIIEKGEFLGKIYDIAPSGYVVVPALKDLPPVKAYSEEFALDEKQEGGMLKLIREYLSDRARLFKQAYGNLDAPQPRTGRTLLDPTYRNQWDEFLIEETAFSRTHDKNSVSLRDAGPLLTTRWDQSDPYNLYCPYGDGGICVVGCVATAAAQVLWYWAWPPYGLGTHTYWWWGDYSCEGETPGRYLTGHFDDPYEYVKTDHNVAELSYEMGIAHEMGYGFCSSGADPGMAVTMFPLHFLYKNQIQEIFRASYLEEDSLQWFDIIKTEINAGRPILYTIVGHEIVCDGWKEVNNILYYHMNYGWGGSHNTWYILDQLYCSGEDCSYMWEYMYTGIEPDKSVYFFADTGFGRVPFDVQFDGNSDLTAPVWNWNFDDGGVSSLEDPLHTFEIPGIYDISLTVSVGAENHSQTREHLVVAVADTIDAPDMIAPRGSIISVPIRIRNTIPLEYIKIPIEYSGDLDLTYHSLTTVGCRTENFEIAQLVAEDPPTKRLAIQLQASAAQSNPPLPPGEGVVVIVKFVVGSPAQMDYTTTMLFDGYWIHKPYFSGDLAGYETVGLSATIGATYVCADVEVDGLVNVLDIIYLIEYKFKGGPAPAPMETADVNSDTQVDILDIIYLVDFKFKGGEPPVCPGM